MATKTQAPMIGPNYPHPDYPLGAAWAAMWRVLERSGDEYLDGRVLADKIAPKHGLASTTLVALISRAAKAGLLDKQPQPVQTARGTRKRTHYRVKSHG
jgi:hypothetical protein